MKGRRGNYCDSCPLAAQPDQAAAFLEVGPNGGHASRFMIRNGEF